MLQIHMYIDADKWYSNLIAFALSLVWSSRCVASKVRHSVYDGLGV